MTVERFEILLEPRFHGLSHERARRLWAMHFLSSLAARRFEESGPQRFPRRPPLGGSASHARLGRSSTRSAPAMRPKLSRPPFGRGQAFGLRDLALEPVTSSSAIAASILPGPSRAGPARSPPSSAASIRWRSAARRSACSRAASIASALAVDRGRRAARSPKALM
jgi:hypothetical protein